MCGFAALSDKGLKRAANEDSYLARPDLRLWIVADGMGGHENGKQASELCCDIVCQYIAQGATAETAINAAHQYIQNLAARKALKRGMGTTVVVLQELASTMRVSWVGDSRAYIFSNNELRMLTKDHSVVQNLVDHELISAQDVRKHPQRNMLTRSLGLGMRSTVEVDSVEFTLAQDDEVLLCSDGLNAELEDSEIQGILAQQSNKQARVDALIKQAKLSGGRDNITAILVDDSNRAR